MIKPLITIAASRDLNALDIYRALRARRDYLPYLRKFLHELETERRPWLMALMCRSVLRRINIPRFQRQLTQSLRDLERTGRALPPERVHELA